MTPGALRPPPLKLVLLAAAPLVLWAGSVVASRVDLFGDRGPVEERMGRESRHLQLTFQRLFEEAARIAETAMSGTPSLARRAAEAGVWSGRLEGVGIVGAEGSFLEWEGSPAEPPWSPEAPTAANWTIYPQGLRVRLVVTSPPREDGATALASFVIDSSLNDLPFRRLLPRSLSSEHLRDIEFLDSSESHEDLTEFFGAEDGVFREGDPSTYYVPIRSPSGHFLALATLQELPAAHRVARIRAVGNAGAAVVLAVLLWALFDWTSLGRRLRGLPLALFALVLGRGVLLLTRAPAHLLPRELGSPSHFGSSGLLGLQASPADFLLTALAVLLGASIIREFSATHATRRRNLSATLSGVSCAASVGILCAMSISLARHARIAPDLFESPSRPLAQAALLLGLVLVMFAAAESAAVFWHVVSGRRDRISSWSERVAVGLALMPLAGLSSTAFLMTSDLLAEQRLRSEFAPQVLEQSSRRALAVRAAVYEAAEREAAREAVLSPPEHVSDYAAYRLWGAGELFHLGYESSLDLYDGEGSLISHFGFELPLLVENMTVNDPATAEVVERDESYTAAPAVKKKVIHVEAPILQEGVRLGTVVGHVLDEPENLPFLPSLSPYVTALGSGVHQDPGQIPDYVLYNRAGEVALSTLRRPPSVGPELMRHARSGSLARMWAGGERFVGLPLVDGERLHLLLLPARPLLDRLAVLAKLFLMAMGVMATFTLIRSVVRHRGLGFLVTGLMGSFYRKLLTSLLLASLLPLVGLAVFLGGYFERIAEDRLEDSAAQVTSVVQRVVGDYAAVQSDDSREPGFTDEILHWLSRVVDQEIHLYEDGILTASSKRELFASGLLPLRLPGEAHRRVVEEGLPYLVLESRLGPSAVPVAYAPVDLSGPDRRVVAAVPLILQLEETVHAAERVEEMLILTTLLLAVLVIAATSLLARTVARPVRDLVDATGRIASGDYSTRLTTRTHDEMAELVEKFNVMAKALAEQRADLERRRDYIEALLSNATTGVISTDDRDVIVTLNPAAARILDEPAAPIRVGEELSEALSRDGELAPLARVLERNLPASGEPEEVDLSRAGQPRRLRLIRVPLPDPSGGAPGSLILLDDVTDLMRSNQLTAWAEMARAIAHEIKNPLTPIQLSTAHLERLLRDHATLPSPEMDACLKTIMKQVDALRDIAAEFSAYAKLPSLAPEPTDPATLLREVIQPYRTASPPGVSIQERYAEAPSILADRRVLSRAVVNLVENALHAMNEGGTLTIGVAPGRDGKEAVLSVEDTGPGLDPDVRARLFEPYFSTKSSGTGLGLAIVRRAVEAHGGRIQVESSKGGGTAFRIHVPAA